jgi:hypothetical protein
MDQDHAIFHADIERRDLLEERRRRGACLRRILEAMPRTGDAAVKNSPLTQRTVLMLADVGHGRDLAVILENGDALAAEANDAGALFGNVGDGAGGEEAVGKSCVIRDP